MNRILLIFCILLISKSIFSQPSSDFYKISDSLFKIKDFKNAAIYYSKGIQTEGGNATINRYLSIVSRWSLAGEIDSAFHYLDVVTTSDKVTRVQTRNLENNVDFLLLKNDKRWQPSINKIQNQAEKNGYLQEEFIYGRKDGIGLTLVQIKPKVKPNGKAIIYVVSGSWFSGYNGIEVPTAALEQYLKKGYSVFAVMHGSQPRYAIPDAINDIKRGIRYVRYNAAKFGIDPYQLGIIGYSAGGHLSLLVATADDKIDSTVLDPIDRLSSRVQAVAVLFPPTDLMNWGGPGFNMINAKAIMKESRVWGALDFKIWNDKFSLYEEVTDTAARNKIGREISPLNFVSPDDPPVFIIHGDADPTVPLQQSQAFINRMKEAGVPNKFVIKKGGKHNADDMKPEWEEFVDWFDKYLK